MRDRSTAIRAVISDLLNGVYAKNADGHRIISPDGIEIRRVMILGSVVDGYSGSLPFAMMTVVDHTGRIKVKAWGRREVGELLRAKMGDFVMVIGRVRRYEGELYLTTELVRYAEPERIGLHLMERERVIVTQRKREAERRLREAGSNLPDESYGTA